MENQGFDVYTGGVAAYSTLGWFDDPITNTIINRSSNQLARLIFTNLHIKLYTFPVILHSMKVLRQLLRMRVFVVGYQC